MMPAVQCSSSTDARTRKRKLQSAAPNARRDHISWHRPKLSVVFLAFRATLSRRAIFVTRRSVAEGPVYLRRGLPSRRGRGRFAFGGGVLPGQAIGQSSR
jgi:hypothetical protein